MLNFGPGGGGNVYPGGMKRQTAKIAPDGGGLF